MSEYKERRKYSPEFKQDAVELSKKIGLSSTAKKLDISATNLQRWKSQTLPIERSQDVVKLQAEVKRLKKQLAEEKAVVEMLKKATAFFFKGKCPMIYSIYKKNTNPLPVSCKRACKELSISPSGYF